MNREIPEQTLYNRIAHTLTTQRDSLVILNEKLELALERGETSVEAASGSDELTTFAVSAQSVEGYKKELLATESVCESFREDWQSFLGGGEYTPRPETAALLTAAKTGEIPEADVLPRELAERVAAWSGKGVQKAASAEKTQEAPADHRERISLLDLDEAPGRTRHNSSGGELTKSYNPTRDNSFKKGGK